MTATVVALPGGVCAPAGFRAAGVAAGIKSSGDRDLALVAADERVAAAAVQTRNQVVAAPVQLTARNVADGHARAVLLNAGNANACTGPDGLAVAEASAAATAAELGCAPGDVLVCSTGVIGVPLPAQPLLGALPALVGALRRDGNDDAAAAILTTDTRTKQAAVRVSDDTGSCVIGGMAKGAGMVAPEMATMLCVLTTDAPLGAPVVSSLLPQVVDATFGRVSVDGCMSTNDAVLLLASGGASQPCSLASFTRALTQVCAGLAEELVRDGEGARKVIRIRVTAAPSQDAAVAIARSVAGSVLFRTAVAGGDPNWGRVLAAMGAGPVAFDPNRVAVSFGGVTVCRFGVKASFDPALAAAALRRPDVAVRIDLGAGSDEATFLTCDLTTEYVLINAEYTT